jgi:adenosylmethionine-8-amino-7-oxononanoate aminotransferase
MQKENINLISQSLGNHMAGCFKEIAATTQKLSNVRSIGAIVAGDLPEHENRNIQLEFHKTALSKGAYIRLLGRTLYWLPPLNTDKETIDTLAQITYDSIQTVF